MLLFLYQYYADASKPTKKDPEVGRLNGHLANGHLGNGHLPNGYADGEAGAPQSHFRERQQLRDAEEFELEGLMSDDDDVPAKERSGVR